MSSQATEGPETLVNTLTLNGQMDATPTLLDDGGWIVTWTSHLQDGSAEGVYQQRYAAIGHTVGVETRISTFTTGTQDDTAVSALADGGWVVSWTSSGQDGSLDGIFQQRFERDGVAVGNETRVNSFTTNAQYDNAMTTLADGGWVVTWTSTNRDGTGNRIYQQRYDSAGVAFEEEASVSDLAAVDFNQSSVSWLSDGGWIVVWSYNGQDGGGSSTHQQRFNNNGIEVGVEQRVNTTTTGEQADVCVAALSDGGWVVTWYGSNDGSDTGIYQQRYGRDGEPSGTEAMVNTAISGTQQRPTVTGLADGGWLVSWTTANNISQQRYDVDGVAVGTETTVNSYTTDIQVDSSVTALEDGWIVNWNSSGQDGSGYGIYQRQYTDLTDPEGHADTRAGSNKNDLLIGFGGDDRLGGKRGNDIMIGGYGDDTYLINSGGDDIQELIAQGNDRVVSKIGFSLRADAGVEDLVLSGKGNLKGTGNVADNLLAGNNGRNTLAGLEGGDRLVGKKGNDALVGGDGADIFVFSTGSDKDVVRDFSAAGSDHDIVDLSRLKSITNFSDLMEHHLTFKRGDVIIDGGRGDVIVLKDASVEELSQGKFLF